MTWRTSKRNEQLNEVLCTTKEAKATVEYSYIWRKHPVVSLTAMILPLFIILFVSPCFRLAVLFRFVSEADPEGVMVVCSNPTFSKNYFIFMGNFKKSWVNWSNRTPFANLNPLSNKHGSGRVFVHVWGRLGGHLAGRELFTWQSAHVVLAVASWCFYFFRIWCCGWNMIV